MPERHTRRTPQRRVGFMNGWGRPVAPQPKPSELRSSSCIVLTVIIIALTRSTRAARAHNRVALVSPEIIRVTASEACAAPLTRHPGAGGAAIDGDHPSA
jgi:hypothetical protein